MRHSLIGVSALLLVLTLALTWPQGLFLKTRVADHNDPHFSIWRLAWIAHALRTDPRHLFDANIFYPETGTLADSDATLLEGAVAAPWLWAHVSPTLVYNGLLLGGIVVSGLGMFLLADYLTGHVGAAIVSAAIFTMAPYRIEHFMHLELQWTMWIPLAFWALHRAIDDGSWRFGALTGVFVWLQVLSCVYYGVFLAMMVVALTVMLTVANVGRARAAFPGLLLGAITAAALTFPYARPYFENAGKIGGTWPLVEIARFSVRPANYLASPSLNWLWGWTADRWGAPERRLFPGAVAIALALMAFAHRPRRLVWVYLALCVIVVELSFGVNGSVYGWLLTRMPALYGLRAPARFSIVADVAIAVMAGFGFNRLDQRLCKSRASRVALVAATVLLLAIEYSSAPMILTPIADHPQDVYRVLKSLGPGVVVELPMPPPDGLPGRDAMYALWSTAHWNPLVNGYSGHYPPAYFDTIERMKAFPDDVSMARLTSLDVRYIVVHRAFYERGEYSSLLSKIARRPDLLPRGSWPDPVDQAGLFELRR